MKGFRIYLTLEGRDILSRDVTFDESIMYSTKSIKTSNLGKEQENLLQTNRVLRCISLPLQIYLEYNLLMMMLRI